MADEILARNTLNDIVDMVPAHYLEHPILGANLVPVRTRKARKSIDELAAEKSEDENGESAKTEKKED